MAERDIVQSSISRLGQSQAERLPRELEPESVAVDERTAADLLAQSRALAQKLRYYRDSVSQPSGDWGEFFPPGDDARLLESAEGGVAPHLGLFGSFALLYGQAQRELNTITARHLDFQMRRVLGFEPLAATPHHAHLICELKKGAAPALIEQGRAFSAGKDAKNQPLTYESVRDVVINHASLVALHSIYRAADSLHFASVANSADGLGEPLDPAHPKWRPFGGADLPLAQVGFALSAPVLRLREGNRKVRATLRLGGLQTGVHTATAVAASFEAHLTGPKSWLGPFALDASVAGNALELSFTVPASQAAVVDYQAALHGEAFAASGPVLQFLLKPGAVLPLGALASLDVHSAQLRVEVDGVHELVLENDSGALNPKKAFLPFGAQPVRGSRFMIGSEEALSKKLLELKLRITWQGAPADLSSWYANYKNVGQFANGVQANMVFVDRSGQTKSAVVDVLARDSAGVATLAANAPPPVAVTFANPVDPKLFAFRFGGSILARLMGSKLGLARPMYRRFQLPAPEARQGFITLSLQDDLLHADYRKESVYNAINRVMVNNAVLVLNEPYTPKAQAISLSYMAESDEVPIGVDAEEHFTNPELQFFQVGCFGARRDHAWLRARLGYVADKRVALVPVPAAEGQLIIGLNGVAAGDSVSLLLQVAEGSADPDLPAQDIDWAVLADNHWRKLTPQELPFDTSRALRASGIVALSLPRETALETTWLPSGHVWLRGSIRQGSGAACQLIAVLPNAVEVRFVDRGNDPAHLAQPLAAGSISKLLLPLSGVKGVKQPYASFGGNPAETDTQLARRAAERLRHRNRCVTPWDYERLLLQAFPTVHKVKCIPHASETSWLAPGHVTLIAIPDLRNANAIDPLAPRVDLDTLTRMAELARAHAGMGVELHVRNPKYQRVRLDFAVRFMPGLAFNFHANLLEQALIRELTPWAWDATAQVSFGGRLFRAALLDFVERQSYVDYVTRFKLGLSELPDSDYAELRADAPDVILVSDARHAIAEA